MRGQTGGDPLKKVKYGDKFNPSAGAWNSFIDAAQWVQQNKNQTGGNSPGLDLPIGHVLIKPNTDIERFQPVKIGPPIFDPNSGTANLFDYWKNNDPVFTAGNVTTGDENSYGIAQQPIKSGSIGVACVRGQTRAKVNVYSTTFKDFATIKPSSDYAKCFALAYGTSRILQIESGTGDKWAVIDLHSERLQVVGGVLTSSLAPGGSATMGLIKPGGTPSSDVVTVEDVYGIVSDTIPSGSPVYGTYDPHLQKVIFEGPQAGLKIYCGKTDATFDPLGTCVCSIWTPDPAGGLSSDTGINNSVVDIGGIGDSLPTGTVVYWSEIDGVNVLLGFVGGTQIPWGCVYGYNGSGSTISAWKPVTVTPTRYTINPADPVGMGEFSSGTRVYNISAYATAQENRFGITQRDIPPGEVGLVRIRGLSYISCNVIRTADKYAVPTSEGGFKTRSYGPCLIYQGNTATGTKDLVVDVHSDRFIPVGGTLAGNMSRCNEADVNVYDSCEAATSETVKFFDPWGMLPSTGLNSSPTQWVFGTYDCDLQKARIDGFRCD